MLCAFGYCRGGIGVRLSHGAQELACGRGRAGFGRDGGARGGDVLHANKRQIPGRRLNTLE
eukprot:1330962-Prymnesium_polylepis.1